MSGEIVQFPSQTVAGIGRCAACKHEWTAVVAFSSRLDPLECPGCGRETGVIYGHYAPIGRQIAVCRDCAADVFHVVFDAVAPSSWSLFCFSCGAEVPMPA